MTTILFFLLAVFGVVAAIALLAVYAWVILLVLALILVIVLFYNFTEPAIIILISLILSRVIYVIIKDALAKGGVR